MQYKYVGEIAVTVKGLGVVIPGQIIEAKNIDHPNFKLVVHNKKRRK